MRSDRSLIVGSDGLMTVQSIGEFIVWGRSLRNFHDIIEWTSSNGRGLSE
jgi:hypothetical protein